MVEWVFAAASCGRGGGAGHGGRLQRERHDGRRGRDRRHDGQRVCRDFSGRQLGQRRDRHRRRRRGRRRDRRDSRRRGRQRRRAAAAGGGSGRQRAAAAQAAVPAAAREAAGGGGTGGSARGGMGGGTAGGGAGGGAGGRGGGGAGGAVSPGGCTDAVLRTGPPPGKEAFRTDPVDTKFAFSQHWVGVFSDGAAYEANSYISMTSIADLDHDGDLGFRGRPAPRRRRRHGLVGVLRARPLGAPQRRHRAYVRRGRQRRRHRRRRLGRSDRGKLLVPQSEEPAHGDDVAALRHRRARRRGGDRRRGDGRHPARRPLRLAQHPAPVLDAGSRRHHDLEPGRLDDRHQQAPAAGRRHRRHRR